MRLPRVRIGRMFEHSAPSTNRIERRCEAPTIFTATDIPASLDKTCETAPSSAWRMSYHRPWSDLPRVDPWDEKRDARRYSGRGLVPVCASPRTLETTEGPNTRPQVPEPSPPS